MKLTIKFISVYLLICCIGCSGNKKLTEVQTINIGKKTFQVPAGVDSAIAFNSKIKAERLFVDTKRENKADSLNKYFSDYLKITEELFGRLEERKQEFREIRQEFLELTKSFDAQKTLTLEQRRKYEKTFEQIAEDSLTISIVTSLLDYYLEYCSEHFKQAYDLNPYNLNSLDYIAICNSDRGLIFKDTLANRDAIETRMKVLDHNKGVASVYKGIADSHFILEEWKKAYEYFFKAHQIYVITSIFDNPEPDTSDWFKKGNIPFYVDTEKYYEYLYWKGRAEIKVHEADSALATFEKALYLAPSKADSSNINFLVKEWILWDDGNIYAAEQKSIIIDSLRQGNYEWAKNAFIRLLPQLKTKKARDNIIWRLARVEYPFLDQAESAADRLYNLVVNADTSKEKSNIYKPPADSLYKVYFKDCGTLLFGLGDKYRDEGFHQKAKQFYVKDTTFEWSGRGKVFLPLSQLVVLDVPDNISAVERRKMANEKILNLLNRAKDFIHEFSAREIDQLYQALSRIYGQQRDRTMLQKNRREWEETKARLRKKTS